MLIEEVGKYLAKHGYGILHQSINIDRLMQTPDNQIAIGTVSTSYLKDKSIKYIFQIRVRNTSYEEAHRISHAIYKELIIDRETSVLELENGRIPMVVPTSTPTFLLQDESSRSNFIFHLTLISNPD